MPNGTCTVYYSYIALSITSFLIAERLSARQLILRRISENLRMYVCTLYVMLQEYRIGCGYFG